MNLSKIIAIVLALIALFAFPVFLNNDYYIHLGTTILIYIILLFGLDIVVGYTGQVSLGHAGLFGVGAYTTGVLFFHLDMPFYVTVPASIAVTAFFGGLLALPALKVIGPLFSDGHFSFRNHLTNFD
jgi:branched-chain amino acid transport system permease protein